MTGERRIASDTGPLITLEKLSNGYRFIRLLYDKILIPRVVPAGGGSLSDRCPGSLSERCQQQERQVRRERREERKPEKNERRKKR